MIQMESKMDGWTKRMVRWLNGWKDVRLARWLVRWQDVWKARWKDVWMVRWLDEWANGWMDQWMVIELDILMTGRMNGCLGGWIDGRWLDEWVDGQKVKNGWMKECRDWLNGQMDIWMFERMVK